jgi:23S rRNA (cytosine1962-C5)-methyltransferase
MTIFNTQILESALTARKQFIYLDAFRLFNGFTEGFPSIVADLYGQTLVLYNFHKDPKSVEESVALTQEYFVKKLPRINSVIVKTRKGETKDHKNGVLKYGEKADVQITENKVRYAIDLQINQDSSFYLDTRNLRHWLQQNMKDKAVLNTFAHTGSFGVAALAGGASHVVQMDLNRKFMGIGKRSYKLNKFPINNKDFMVGDFFSCVKQFKIANKHFDCVILDPPFFSSTKKGRVDLNQNNKQLINKLRPLINDQGYLVVINNALFLSGSDFMASIQELCSDNYVSFQEMIQVPQDVVGYMPEGFNAFPADSKPFNHPTKIVILKIKRK